VSSLFIEGSDDNLTQLCKLEECNQENIKLIGIYQMIMRIDGLTEKSREAFTQELQLFLRYIGQKNLFDINHKIVEGYLFYCLDERKNKAAALNRKYTALNSFFEKMIRKDYFPDNFKNPMHFIDKMKTRPVIKDYLTEKEYDRVVKYLESTNDIKGICLVNLAYSSACRVSEIEQLNRDSISMETRYFNVYGKGEKPRECFISLQGKQAVINYLNTRTDDLEPLFLSRVNTRWKKRDIERYVKKLIEAVGITKHITPHSFRHSVLTNMRKAGTRLEDLQLLAGHASIATTQAKYTHIGLSDVSSKFDKFFEVKEGDNN